MPTVSGGVAPAMPRKPPFAPAMPPDAVAKVGAFAALDAPPAITGANLEVHG